MVTWPAPPICAASATAVVRIEVFPTNSADTSVAGARKDIIGRSDPPS
jgi:hypothetical protein